MISMNKFGDTFEVTGALDGNMEGLIATQQG